MLDEKRITYDCETAITPKPGDVLQTKRGKLRLVIASRKVNSRRHPSRWALTVTEVSEAPKDVAVFTLAWKPRRRKKA
jgi:hypothetical protein